MERLFPNTRVLKAETYEIDGDNNFTFVEEETK